METSRRAGQALVIFAIALIFGMIPMIALIVDGGVAFAQHRGTQNASDAASETGATTLAQNMFAIQTNGIRKTDADVLSALDASAAANRIKPFSAGTGNSVAYYTDIQGEMLAISGGTTTVQAQAIRVGSLGAALVPTCSGSADCTMGVASGVIAYGTRDFDTTFARVIGMSQFTASAKATSVAGYIQCDEASICGFLPVTFATVQNTCDGSGNAVYDPSKVWRAVDPPYTAANEATLSLCKKGEGAFGWLDLGPGNTADEITNPPTGPYPVPSWLLGQPGNPNNVEDELDAYHGPLVGVYEPGLDKGVFIPFFDALCNEDRPDGEAPVFPGPTGPFPGECSGNPSGGGANRYYHIPYYIGFIMDEAYVQGNNFPECNVPPGGPLPLGNGSGGCLKGWISIIAGPPGPVGSAPPGGNPDAPLGVQLIA